MDVPYFPKYAKDWLTGEGTRLMTPEQRGAFDWLLCHAWLSNPPCTLPDDDDALAKLSDLGARWKRVGAAIRAQFQAFPEDSNRIYNKKQLSLWEELNEHRERRSQAGRKGNAKRWSSESQRDRIAIAKGSPSSSSSLSPAEMGMSSTSPSAGDVESAKSVLQPVVTKFAPALPLLDEECVSGWLSDFNADPWLLAMALIEALRSNSSKIRSLNYLHKVFESRAREGWNPEGLSTTSVQEFVTFTVRSK